MAITIDGLYCELSGSGDPILLIHGSGANTRIWGSSSEELAAANRVIAYDRRGFGRSATPPAKSMRDHVTDAAGLLRRLEAGPATVVGWSAGGVFAAGLAVEHPTMVAALVLEEPRIRLPLNPTASLLRSGVSVPFARRFQRDERRAARTLFEFVFASSCGTNQFERFPPDWRDSMLASAHAVCVESDHLLWPYPSRRAISSIDCSVT